MTYIAVYGSLRRGGEYHSFLADARFMASGYTALPYGLYLGSYPQVVKDVPDSEKSPIRVEVYQVNQPELTALDHLEEHPEVYCREQVKVILDSIESTQEVQAWLYFYPCKAGIWIPEGDYIAYCLAQKNKERDTY